MGPEITIEYDIAVDGRWRYRLRQPGDIPHKVDGGWYGDWPKKDCKRKANSLVRRVEWKWIWQTAYNNMPVRIQRQRHWSVLPKDTVPIAEFIKNPARRRPTMKQANGLIFKLTTTEHEYGRNSAFRTLMRYNTNGGHNRISFNMSRGVRPRDPASRILLQTLAGPRGKYIALEMLLKGPRARLYLKYKVPTE